MGLFQQIKDVLMQVFFQNVEKMEWWYVRFIDITSIVLCSIVLIACLYSFYLFFRLIVKGR